ncbi:hypothetical protein BC939DRAFT_475055 [Gamsiella multidivaricata]|uniref:uncharacterized protein n=1 Tax=Gamsiella multidivaricata TaxID=101098 RepID=UPI002220FE0D|nr:uncharacterized protein BC939DRAFT_475055 [Gamsiella multidivaricata]KAI7828013.1 hypothetical protein BC939DRAFT_475055 [Gamsiella multidivaricata]
MDESAEQQLNQALLEKLEPLINTIESQLRDLVQGQAILQSNVVEISSELNLTQEELERAYDTATALYCQTGCHEKHHRLHNGVVQEAQASSRSSGHRTGEAGGESAGHQGQGTGL